MKRPISDIAFSPAVKVEQQRLGSREMYDRMEQRGGWSEAIRDGRAAVVIPVECTVEYIVTHHRINTPTLHRVVHAPRTSGHCAFSRARSSECYAATAELTNVAVIRGGAKFFHFFRQSPT